MAIGELIPLFRSVETAQVAADYWAQAGGWREPGPLVLGRDYDPDLDDDFTRGAWA
jgi:hypothetical protein